MATELSSHSAHIQLTLQQFRRLRIEMNTFNTGHCPVVQWTRHTTASSMHNREKYRERVFVEQILMH